MRNVPFVVMGRFRSKIFSPSLTAMALRASPSEMLFAISKPVIPLSKGFAEPSGNVRVICGI